MLAQFRQHYFKMLFVLGSSVAEDKYGQATIARNVNSAAQKQSAV